MQETLKDCKNINKKLAKQINKLLKLYYRDKQPHLVDMGLQIEYIGNNLIKLSKEMFDTWYGQKEKNESKNK
jgi:hypothetical protein